MFASTANAKVIKVGTSVNYEPFTYVGVSFKLMGFELDLIEEMSKRVDFKYKVESMDYVELVPALLSGKIDMIASAISITTDLINKANFTNPYYRSSNAYIKLKNRDDIITKNDLKGKTICVLKGREQEKVANDIENAKVITVKNIYTAIMHLDSGSVDAILVDEAVGDYYAQKSVNKEVFLNEEYVTMGFGFALSKDGDPEFINSLNIALDEIMLDGTYEKLLNKYNLIKGKI